MKRFISAVVSVLLLFILIIPVNTLAESPKEEIFTPDYVHTDKSPEFSPSSSDNLNVILMAMCLSGGGLVILVVMTIVSKTSKK